MAELRLISGGEAADPRILRCDCGKVTTFQCRELWPHDGLVPCRLPLCEPTCAKHRHKAGTMGYVNFSAGSADYMGDTPDDDSFTAWVKSVCRILFWSKKRKAQYVWDGMKKRFPPPAPLPPFVLRFGSTHFAAFGDEMRELE